MNPALVILSHPTSGATPAATYSFITQKYKPPASQRDMSYDVVHNQNGRFKYIYDNGPGFKVWSPFVIRCDNAFQTLLNANALAQYGHLEEMWNYKGIMGMETPEGIYNVHWSTSQLERGFVVFPREVGDSIEYDITVQFEEAQ